MKLRITFLILLVLITGLFALPSTIYAKPPSVQHQQVGQTPLICINTPPDSTGFPNISINFRMLDENLTPMTPVDNALRFAENGNPAMPLVNSIQSVSNGVGVDYYFIIDKGNRTSQVTVRKILQTFIGSGYYNEQSDTIKIYTNQNNDSQVYYPNPDNGNTLAETITNFPTDLDTNYRTINRSLDKLLKEIETTPDPCHNTRFIIVVSGDNVLAEDEVSAYSQRVKASLAKLVFLHVNGLYSGTYASSNIYGEFANQSGGVYRQIKSLDNDIKPGFDMLMQYRQTFTATYRTNYGAGGNHEISAIYQNENIPVKGQATYPLSIISPSVSLIGEAVINRSAQSKTVSGEYVYNSESLPYTIKVDWGDTFPREIKNASLLLREGDIEDQTSVSLTPKGENEYEINWNYSTVKTSGIHPVYLTVKIVDEFGYEAISSPLNITITNSTEIADKVPTWVPTVFGVFAVVVVVLIILMIFMWGKMRKLAQQGGAVISKFAGEVRKTILGGGKKGKALATLKVIDGPAAMIGQDLKVYTESIRLGRNPQLADMTFYGPDINTSISGLHARLEKMGGNWRIVAISQSGSETFIDDQPIPFNEPAMISNGQKIRMGYFAQQPVILEFSTEQVESQTQISTNYDDPRKTEFFTQQSDSPAQPARLFGRPGNNVAPQVNKKPAADQSDSIFDDIRNS